MNPTLVQSSESPVSQSQSRTSGMAIASMVIGILSIMGFAIFLIPIALAVILGHVSYSKIKKDPQLTGEGFAIAGFVMGYVSIVLGIFPVGLMAAMAIPAFQKVRITAQMKTLQNEARQISSASFQYFLETGEEEVTFSVDPETGKIQGPLSTYIRGLTPGTFAVDGTVEMEDGSFSIGNQSFNNGELMVFDSDANIIDGWDI